MWRLNVLLGFLLALALCAPAWADRGRSHVGIVVAYPWGWPYPPAYYYPPYYPPTVVIQAPPLYVEQGSAPAPQETSYWYYCSTAQAYYPYVNECPSGWQKVAAQPAKHSQ